MKLHYQFRSNGCEGYTRPVEMDVDRWRAWLRRDYPIEVVHCMADLLDKYGYIEYGDNKKYRVYKSPNKP